MGVMAFAVAPGDCETMARTQQRRAGMRLVTYGRSELLADLERAVEPGSSRQTLAIVVVGGLDHFRELYGSLEAEALVELARMCLGDALDERARLYQPRSGEFAVLAAASVDEVEQLLGAAAEELSHRFDQYAVSAACGAVLLPDEATEVGEALILADERLLVHAVAPQSRERRGTSRS